MQTRSQLDISISTSQIIANRAYPKARMPKTPSLDHQHTAFQHLTVPSHATSHPRQYQT